MNFIAELCKNPDETHFEQLKKIALRTIRERNSYKEEYLNNIILFESLKREKVSWIYWNNKTFYNRHSIWGIEILILRGVEGKIYCDLSSTDTPWTVHFVIKIYLVAFIFSNIISPHLIFYLTKIFFEKKKIVLCFKKSEFLKTEWLKLFQNTYNQISFRNFGATNCFFRKNNIPILWNNCKLIITYVNYIQLNSVLLRTIFSAFLRIILYLFQFITHNNLYSKDIHQLPDPSFIMNRY